MANKWSRRYARIGYLCALPIVFAIEVGRAFTDGKKVGKMLGSFVKSPAGLAALLASAIGGPYVLYETDAGKYTRDSASHFWQTSEPNPGGLNPSYYAGSDGMLPNVSHNVGQPTLVPGNTATLWNYTTGTPTLSQLQQTEPQQMLVGAPIHDLRAVMRFDIAPGWIPLNFSRVSTVLSEKNMDGLRVPIVTGTLPTDLAGTLTYYFDQQHQLRRITLHGLTGDPNALAQIMMGYYQLAPEPSLGGHLYTTKWNGRVTSLMQITPAPVIYSTAQFSKYVVFIELNQPSFEYGLSYEAQNLLTQGKQTNRW